MALDGIMFEGVSVRVRRPNDYNPAAAVGLGARCELRGSELVGVAPWHRTASF